MTLYDFAKIYAIEYYDTAALEGYITIRRFNNDKQIWEGRIKDLFSNKNNALASWKIVEMIVDHNRKGEENLPAYNKAKILKVI